jgi:transposase InsO family protein
MRGNNIDGARLDLPQPAHRRRRTRLPFADELVRKRISVLELAAQLGNVSEACRRTGMDRASFYDWRHRFQAHGIAGLHDIQPLPCTDAIPADLQEKICTLALAGAANTSARIEAILMLEGRFVAASAVQRILTEHGLGTPEARWLRLEQQARCGADSLTAAQIALIEKFNPCFRERTNASAAPGSLLVQDTVSVAAGCGGKLYLHVVIDTFACFAFGALFPDRNPQSAVALLESRVLPFYGTIGRAVTAIATDGGHEFCGEGACSFKAFLRRHGIAHVLPLRGRTRANGFMERFCRLFMEDFVRKTSAEDGCMEEWQWRFEAWLKQYDHEAPHQGYPNYGHTPLEATAPSILEKKSLFAALLSEQ